MLEPDSSILDQSEVAVGETTHGPSRYIRENSNMVRISSATTSVWRGNLWSTIPFKVKVDKYFLANSIPGNGFYCLQAHIEQEGRNGWNIVTPDPSKIQLEFGPVCSKKNKVSNSSAIIKDNPYNIINLRVHQDAFDPGERFTVVVVARLNNDSHMACEWEDILGRSHVITVTDYSLAIEACFLDNPYVSRITEDEFFWYNKCGGESAGLDVRIQLKDAQGRLVNRCKSKLALNTELVYADGSSTPIMPLSPLKERRTKAPSQTPLYHPLKPEPELDLGETSHDFAFRIEEVSFHHPNQGGFKLKVSPVGITDIFIHPGMLKETIIVLSKPKYDPNKKSGKRKSSQMIDDDASTTGPDIEATKCLGSMTQCVPSSQKDTTTGLEIPVMILTAGFLKDGKCICCQRGLKPRQMLDADLHDRGCHFTHKIFPRITCPVTGAGGPQVPRAQPLKRAKKATITSAGGVFSAVGKEKFPKESTMPAIPEEGIRLDRISFNEGGAGGNGCSRFHMAKTISTRITQESTLTPTRIIPMTPMRSYMGMLSTANSTAAPITPVPTPIRNGNTLQLDMGDKVAGDIFSPVDCDKLAQDIGYDCFEPIETVLGGDDAFDFSGEDVPSLGASEQVAV